MTVELELPVKFPDGKEKWKRVTLRNVRHIPDFDGFTCDETEFHKDIAADVYKSRDGQINELRYDDGSSTPISIRGGQEYVAMRFVLCDSTPVGAVAAVYAHVGETQAARIDESSEDKLREIATNVSS